MYKIESFRFRKPLAECSYNHRARISALLKRADNNLIASSFDNFETSATTSSNKSVVNDAESVHIMSDVDTCSVNNEIVNGIPLEQDNSQAEDQESVYSGFEVGSVYLSSSDESSCNHDSLEEFENKLALAFTETNMSHVQAKAILQVVKTHECFSDIHVDPRSILKTPAVSATPTQIAGGEYLHLGVAQGLQNILSVTPAHMIPDILQLDWSTDGASLDKCNKVVLWPIQIRIANIAGSAPEVIGIFRGSSKPVSASEFFQPFVNELLLILQNGIQFCGLSKAVELRCFIADAPARAFALGHRGHNSCAPCSRCWVRGKFLRPGVMVYQGTDFVARTQEEYSERLDADHHKGSECSLGELPFNAVLNRVFD